MRKGDIGPHGIAVVREVLKSGGIEETVRFRTGQIKLQRCSAIGDCRIKRKLCRGE